MALRTDVESAGAGALSQHTRKLHSSHNRLGRRGEIAEIVLCRIKFFPFPSIDNPRPLLTF